MVNLEDSLDINKQKLPAGAFLFRAKDKWHIMSKDKVIIMLRETLQGKNNDTIPRHYATGGLGFLREDAKIAVPDLIKATTDSSKTVRESSLISTPF